MSRTIIALSVVLMFMGTVVASIAFAAVKPVPAHPGHYQVIAKTATEHKAAAENAKKYAVWLKGMANHHKSMAAEHKKIGNTKLAKHHENLAKNQAASAKEYEAVAKTHIECAKQAKK